MTERTGAAIAAYLADLRSAMGTLGGERADEIVADIASLLREAADEGPDAVDRMLEELGPPQRLADGYLSEHGFGPESGMGPAEWWRLGAAAVADLLVGLSVPIAVSFPFWVTIRQAGYAGGVWAWAFGALFAGALVWPWYAWRPWWVNGQRQSAGMALTRISVVRIAGARRVVRDRDLDRLGRVTGGRGAASGLASLLIAVGLMGCSASFLLGEVQLLSEGAAVESMAGPLAEQKVRVADAATQMYDSLVRFRSDYAGENSVELGARDAYKALVKRAATERISSFEVGEPERLSVGAWRVDVVEKTPLGAHRVTLTYTLRIVVQPGDGNSWGFGDDWVLYRIQGAGLPRSW